MADKLHARHHRPALLLSLLVVVASCGGQTEPFDTGTDAAEDAEYGAYCESINPAHCLLPWPSSFYLVDDAATATGRRVELRAEAMPRSGRGRPIDLAAYNRADGFSPMTPLVTSLAGELDGSLLAGEDRIAETLESGSTT